MLLTRQLAVLPSALKLSKLQPKYNPTKSVLYVANQAAGSLTFCFWSYQSYSQNTTQPSLCYMLLTKQLAVLSSALKLSKLQPKYNSTKSVLHVANQAAGSLTFCFEVIKPWHIFKIFVKHLECMLNKKGKYCVKKKNHDIYIAM